MLCYHCYHQDCFNARPPPKQTIRRRLYDDEPPLTAALWPQVSEEIIWELFCQAGPVANVYVPKDRVTNTHQGYGFVEFRAEEDADYVRGLLDVIVVVIMGSCHSTG